MGTWKWMDGWRLAICSFGTWRDGLVTFSLGRLFPSTLLENFVALPYFQQLPPLAFELHQLYHSPPPELNMTVPPTQSID